MKLTLIRMLLFLMFAAQPAFAQIHFNGKFEHSRYVQFESIPVALTIANKTGNTLLLGEVGGETRIRFEIKDAGGHFMPVKPDAGTIALLVGAGRTVTTNINIRDYYRLDKPGNYTITPMLVTASRTFLSPKSFIDIVSGSVADEMVLDVEGSTRTYSLRVCTRDRQDDLFLRIDDRDNGLCYGVYPLGNILRFQPPRMELDEEDRLHIVHQPHPDYLTHHVFSLNGALIRKAAYRKDGGGELLDDQDHMDLMDLEGAMNPVPAPAASPAAVKVLPPPAVPDASSREVDAIMEDLESAPVESDPLRQPVPR